MQSLSAVFREMRVNFVCYCEQGCLEEFHDERVHVGHELIASAEIDRHKSSFESNQQISQIYIGEVTPFEVRKKYIQPFLDNGHQGLILLHLSVVIEEEWNTIQEEQFVWVWLSFSQVFALEIQVPDLNSRPRMNYPKSVWVDPHRLVDSLVIVLLHEVVCDFQNLIEVFEILLDLILEVVSAWNGPIHVSGIAQQRCQFVEVHYQIRSKTTTAR